MLLLIGTSLAPLPNSVNLTASDVHAQEISFTFDVDSLQNDGNLNKKNVQLSGIYSLTADTTLAVTVEDNTDSDTPKDLSSNIKINPDDTWSFSADFPDGAHKVTFTASDGKDTITKKVSFKVDTKRPIARDYKLISNNHTGNSTEWNSAVVEDMTHVPLDVSLQIKVKESSKINYKMDKDGNILNPIIVKANNVTKIISNEVGQNPPKPDEDGNYIITFTPKEILTPNTTYYVYITNNIEDESGNSVTPKLFKFTTTSGNEALNPHGHFTNNTNMCSYCHSTHNGSTAALQGGLLTDLENRKDVYPNLPIDPSKSYCLACHDGTMNAPLANNIDKTYQHNNPANATSDHSGTNALQQTDSCTSCHNPHADWAESNPNLLKEHDIFLSNKGAATIDGIDVTCDSCHGDNPTIGIDQYQGHTNEIYSYKKSTTAVGDIAQKAGDKNNNTVSDYSLCLRCHNAKEENGAKDIETYFINSSSAHFIALPSGKTTQDDGSLLNGPLPCAECHETHGSDNIKMLRTQLGNVQNGNSFSTNGQTWDAANERKFCLSCHNNSTVLYGKVIPLPPEKNSKSGSDIGAHKQSSTSACSSCHGAGANKALSAVHSPIRK